MLHSGLLIVELVALNQETTAHRPRWQLGLGSSPRIRHITLHVLMLDQDIADNAVSKCIEQLQWLVIFDEADLKYSSLMKPYLSEVAIREWISYFQACIEQGADYKGIYAYQEVSMQIEWDGEMHVHSVGDDYSCPPQAFVDELKKLVHRFDQACLPL